MGTGLKTSGGEGGILLPPFMLSTSDAYTSVIISCALASYKRIRSRLQFLWFLLFTVVTPKTVSVVSVITIQPSTFVEIV